MAFAILNGTARRALPIEGNGTFFPHPSPPVTSVVSTTVHSAPTVYTNRLGVASVPTPTATPPPTRTVFGTVPTSTVKPPTTALPQPAWPTAHPSTPVLATAGGTGAAPTPTAPTPSQPGLAATASPTTKLPTVTAPTIMAPQPQNDYGGPSNTQEGVFGGTSTTEPFPLWVILAILGLLFFAMRD